MLLDFFDICQRLAERILRHLVRFHLEFLIIERDQNLCAILSEVPAVEKVTKA